METFEIKEHHGKNKGILLNKITHISAANFPSVAHLVSYGIILNTIIKDLILYPF